MLDHLGSADRADSERSIDPRAERLARKKARSEQIARSGCVDKLPDRFCGG